MASSSKPILTYFNGRGRAEVARLIFAETGTAYEDNRVQDHSELKKSGKLPFGQLPILQVGDVTIAQSQAINRYLAREHGLAGKNSLENAQVDMVIDGWTDLTSARFAAKTDEEKAKFASETLPTWLGHLEKIVAANGSGYFVGSGLTVADIVGFVSLDYVKTNAPTALEHFPALSKLYELVLSRPNINNWVKNRPVTPF